MDDENTLREVDKRLRGALRSDAVAGRRLVLRALAADRGPVSRVRSLRLAVVIAAALAVAVGVSAWQWRRTARIASPSVRSPDPPSLAITGRGSLLVVDSQDGRRWIVGPAPERRTGGNYVMVLR